MAISLKKPMITLGYIDADMHWKYLFPGCLVEGSLSVSARMAPGGPERRRAERSLAAGSVAERGSGAPGVRS